MTDKQRAQLAKQTDLAQRMAQHGVNLVDCPDCGSTLLHETNEADISCPFCGFESEPADFPDHFYEGFEQSAEFQDND